MAKAKTQQKYTDLPLVKAANGYKEPDEQETGICNACGSELEPIYENTHPDGIPGYTQIVGYKPCPCRGEN